MKPANRKYKHNSRVQIWQRKRLPRSRSLQIQSNPILRRNIQQSFLIPQQRRNIQQSLQNKHARRNIQQSLRNKHTRRNIHQSSLIPQQSRWTQRSRPNLQLKGRIQQSWGNKQPKRWIPQVQSNLNPGRRIPQKRAVDQQTKFFSLKELLRLARPKNKALWNLVISRLPPDYSIPDPGFINMFR